MRSDEFIAYWVAVRFLTLSQFEFFMDKLPFKNVLNNNIFHSKISDSTHQRHDTKRTIHNNNVCLKFTFNLSVGQLFERLEHMGNHQHGGSHEHGAPHCGTGK